MCPVVADEANPGKEASPTSRAEVGRRCAVVAPLFSELAIGMRPVGRPKLRYKDTCKRALKCGGVIDHWRKVVRQPA